MSPQMQVKEKLAVFADTGPTYHAQQLPLHSFEQRRQKIIN
jgi:hypothetical protein